MSDNLHTQNSQRVRRCRRHCRRHCRRRRRCCCCNLRHAKRCQAVGGRSPAKKGQNTGARLRPAPPNSTNGARASSPFAQPPPPPSSVARLPAYWPLSPVDAAVCDRSPCARSARFCVAAAVRRRRRILIDVGRACVREFVFGAAAANCILRFNDNYFFDFDFVNKNRQTRCRLSGCGRLLILIAFAAAIGDIFRGSKTAILQSCISNDRNSAIKCNFNSRASFFSRVVGCI